MANLRLNGQTSNKIRLILGVAGLAFNTSDLLISTICDVEATATVYAEASSNIETITTLGTFAAPTSSKCRFKEVDATNHPGLYELQFADARFSVSNAKSVIISISGATGLPDGGVHYEIQLDAPVAQVDDIRTDMIRKGVSYRHTNDVSSETADVTIDDVP